MENDKHSNPLNDPDSLKSSLRYKKRLAEHDVSSEALGWRRGTQEIRFQAFKSGFGSTPPSSILDIGCGFANLLDFLKNQGWEGTYVGIDLVPEFIAIARNKYPADNNSGVKFICSDFMDYDFDVQFDACFASGLFNFKRSSNNIEYLFLSLQKMQHLTKEYSAIDMLSATSDRRQEDLFFYHAGEVMDLASQLTKRIIIDHSYMPFEFMIKLYWTQNFKKDWPVFPAR